MTATKPLLYVSRLLPDPVMVAIRERFALVREPIDAAPSLSALQEGLSKAAAAIVTLTDRIDAQTLESARELKVLAELCRRLQQHRCGCRTASRRDRDQYAGRPHGCDSRSHLGIDLGHGTARDRRRSARSQRSMGRLDTYTIAWCGGRRKDNGRHRDGPDRSGRGSTRRRLSDEGAVLFETPHRQATERMGIANAAGVAW